MIKFINFYCFINHRRNDNPKTDIKNKKTRFKKSQAQNYIKNTKILKTQNFLVATKSIDMNIFTV